MVAARKMYRVGDLPAQWQGVQRQQQTTNGIFPQLRGCCRGRFRLLPPQKTIIRGSEPHLRGAEIRKTLRQLPGTGQLGTGVRRNDVGGSSAVNGQETDVAGLNIGVGKGHIDNALFAVDDRIFAVRVKPMTGISPSFAR